jgi:hypothetical protein
VYWHRRARRLPRISNSHGNECFPAIHSQGTNRAIVFDAHRLTEYFDVAQAETSAPAVKGDRQHLMALLEERKQIELEALTAKQRQVIEEVVFKGRTITAIAAETKTAVDALRQRIVGTRRPNGKRHGGISRKAPVLFALWLIRHGDRHDVSEVLDAISRAAECLPVLSNFDVTFSAG